MSLLRIAEVLSSLSNIGGLYGWRQCCLPCFALPGLTSQALLQLQTLSDSEHTNGYCCFDLLNLGSSVTLYIAVYPYANPIRARVYTIGAFRKAASRTSKKTPQWREGRKLEKKDTKQRKISHSAFKEPSPTLPLLSKRSHMSPVALAKDL